MKHVIIIETPGEQQMFLDTETEEEFRAKCVDIVDIIANHYYTAVCVTSRFKVESALAAVKEMYGAD